MRNNLLKLPIKPIKTIRKLKSGDETTIVALGDSLTHGWMVRKGYIDFMEEMLRETFPESRFLIINRGIPGDTAEGGLYRLRGDALDFSPDCVFVQFALNDAFCGYSAAQFKQYIQRIIHGIKDYCNAEIVLITSVYVGNSREPHFVGEFYRQLEILGEENGLPVAQVHDYWEKKIDEGVEFRTLVQGDLVHPTVEGYRLMAEAVMQLFEGKDADSG
jgi:lysophospholipase L1-like esterase